MVVDRYTGAEANSVFGPDAGATAKTFVATEIHGWRFSSRVRDR
jgi:hypothetical protein